MAFKLMEAKIEVSVDFSQFYLRFEGDEPPREQYPGTHLVEFFSPENLLFTAGRQWGAVVVSASILSSRPEALGDVWKDVAEMSVTGSSHVTVSGWEPTEHDYILPLTAGRTYRVRYAISDMDDARANFDGEEAPGERYLLQIWEEPPSQPTVVRTNSKLGQIYYISFLLDPLKSAMTGAPEGVSDEEGVKSFITRALTSHPEIVDALRAGVPGTALGLTSAASRFDHSGMPMKLTPEEQGAWSRAKHAKLLRWIREAARDLGVDADSDTD